MSPANAAVMVSGSTIDSAGNYVDGYVSVYKIYDEDGDGTVEPFEYDFLPGVSTQGGAFDIPLEDGTYKLEFGPSSNQYASEYYRDKADLTTADLVTVAGAGQVLSPWTIDRLPSVAGVVQTTDGRPVRDAVVRAYDAVSGNYVDQDETETNGVFRIGATAPVKLVFSGSDPASGESLATEWFNDKGSKETADAVTPTPEGANIGAVTLAPGGSISGSVTNEAGAGLYRAEVCVDNNPYHCDFTNTSGAYTIEGVSTGSHTVDFDDPIGEYVGEYYNNVPLTTPASANPVAVAPGQAVTGIDAALAAAPAAAPNGVDVSGTVRDEVGGIGIGYEINVYDTPADVRDRKVVATTFSNRSGQYQFSQLDRIGGETEFKIVVEGDGPREEGDFARREIWSGDKLGYDTAVAITAAPRVLDFVQPVAGGVSGTVTSEAGGVPDNPFAVFHDSDDNFPSYVYDFELNGSYDERSLWAGEYTVQLGAYDHVSEWWKDAVAGEATTITVRPGQMTTGISAALAKDVKAVDRPALEGDAWVGKTISLDKGRWTTEAGSRFTYEWLVGNTVIATGASLKVTKAHLGKKITGRVTNDAGFTQGQAITKSTAKVGYQPKLKAKVSGKKIALVLKAKPLKAKKVKATVVVYEVVGTKANGETKLKKLGKAKVKKGLGTVKLKKALKKGKHKLVFRIAGAGKVGSGDLLKKVKIKR
ncbi:hypothetical protein [Nocardioides astragali]|uniref:Carboxypeptidase regulatory-like domain-containing protein n=1 Tax=Nocardioides astragali TaxID=1776736 RepID=A0ABW2N1H2_9ACTN|nr:hypothetical protein [Nocardioides astragali]